MIPIKSFSLWSIYQANNSTALVRASMRNTRRKIYRLPVRRALALNFRIWILSRLLKKEAVVNVKIWRELETAFVLQINGTQRHANKQF